MKVIHLLREMLQFNEKFLCIIVIMRIIAISDTHTFHREINLPPYKEGDVLVHAGDITGRGELETIFDFTNWINDLPYENVIVIAGNHDFCFENEYHYLAKDILEKEGKIKYLEDSSIEIDNVKFYGSPWTLRFHDWAFNADKGESIQRKLDLIPKDTDVLVTHGPAKGHVGGMLREVYSGKEIVEDLGCEQLLNKIIEINPKIHICGHIHDGYGIFHHDACQTIFCNASFLSEAYDPTNQPFIIPIKENKNEKPIH